MKKRLIIVCILWHYCFSMEENKQKQQQSYEDHQRLLLTAMKNNDVILVDVLFQQRPINLFSSMKTFEAILKFAPTQEMKSKIYELGMTIFAHDIQRIMTPEIKTLDQETVACMQGHEELMLQLQRIKEGKQS